MVMPPKRDLCAECRSYAFGAVDRNSGRWNCNSCWNAYSGAAEDGSFRDRPVGSATHDPTLEGCYSTERKEMLNRMEPPAAATMVNRREIAGNRDGKLYGAQSADNGMGGAVNAAWRRLASMISSCPPLSRATSLAHARATLNDFEKMSASSSSFVAACMQAQKMVCVVAHSGASLSPRGDNIGGSGRSAYQELRKVSLDMLLSSIDDIVSQVYVNFDEDLTKVLLNGLDRVTACETADQRDRTKVRVIDELLGVLGDRHYDLLQCIMHKPRDVFLRLLEEFCTLEDEEEQGANGGKGGMEPCGLTVRFLKSSGKQRSSEQEISFDNSGGVANQRWLSHMNNRYRTLMAESTLDQIFRKDFSLTGSITPKGTTFSKQSDHVRVHIPPPKLEILPQDKRICIATSLPAWTHPAFLSITHLNTIQTAIFQTAFYSSQNMLVCAPTGAGKTVCALLVMLRCINEHFENGRLDRDFKMIFVAPMKALAQEMVENFSRCLAPFMIKVRELTGDMQLTKHEIAVTQVIVTTPEKWDVITRRLDNEDLTSKVKLIILDEIHLLNEERGPVLEALVARTLKRGEADASRRVRLVGLSATLPNHKDIAHFLRVDLREGMKVFGPEYRPVPLEQTFIGLQNVGVRNKEQALDRLAYLETLRNVKQGHQVMVFVHSRKQTVNLCKYFMEESKRRGEANYFCCDTDVPESAHRKASNLQGRDLLMLFNSGFGAHHAGLIRFDRTATEDLFREGYIRVLCCTSTLAWGVNLPAHTVIVRGTQIYDARRGGLVSISVLDVMQIFGRAGRPQFDTSGHGIIISDEKEVSHFLRLIASALPIESQMQSKLCDHINAEVNAGTISSIPEASSWLEYTYLWQRIRVNPLVYGLKVNHVRNDPELKGVRYEMVNDAFSDLAVAGMVRYNAENGSVESTDLGRLASYYYLTHETISILNKKMQRPDGTWIDSLDRGAAMNLVACASEFAQLRVRPEELDELQQLHFQLPKPVREYRISGESVDETSVQWKVTTLLKAYVSRLSLEAPSLSSDMNYIVQNVPRIARALFEIELERGHPLTTYVFLTLCKCVEHRCWDFEHPLLQFSLWAHKVNLTDAVWSRLNTQSCSMSQLQEMSAKEIGELVHNFRSGRDIAMLVAKFPNFSLAIDIQPITHVILRVKVTIQPQFEWSREISGNSELFWLLVEDQGNNFIFHRESVTITRREVESGTPHIVNLVVPIMPNYDIYSVRLYSDRWMGCREDYIFSIGHLHLPEDAQMMTKLLPLSPLRLHALPEKYHCLFANYNQFNAVQTQVFHAMYHTDQNVFLGAPTGSGKTIAAEMAVLRVFEKFPGKKVVYIAPLKALVKERLRDWKGRMARVGRSVVELSGDSTPDISALVKADIVCTTPEKWDGISRNWQVRTYVTSVKLVVFDEIHMLGTDRGPILEVIVSRMRYIGWSLKDPIRLVGLSTAVANPADLSSWLGIEKKWAFFNFDPSVRPVPMIIHIAGYHGKKYCSRMEAMNKPAYNSICEKSPTQPVIVFVSSRRQTRRTAMALIRFLSLEGDGSKWAHMSVDESEKLMARLSDDYVRDCLRFGVGMHHAGLLEGDRTVVEEAFLSGKIQVLVTTSTLAWGVNFPAHMVVVKGTEYYDAKTRGYVDIPITDVLQMVGRAGRPQFDTEGVAQVLCHEPKKSFYRKFLYDPFPVESVLHKQLHVHINAEIVSGIIATRQDAINYLTWTYFFRRITRNPSYYGLDDPSPEAVTVFLSNLVKNTLDELEACGCIEPTPTSKDGFGSEVLHSTVLGKLCSYYYISHHTVELFRRSLTPSVDMEEILRLLCAAKEFDELPVRHNEDLLNKEFAQKLGTPFRDAEADSPHFKALLLFQAHFSRADLPIVDYVTDQKSAMENAVRIIQAMIDIAANQGFLHTALRCMALMQFLVQGLWHNSSTLLQIPHVTLEMLPVISLECRLSEAAELAKGSAEVLERFKCILRRPTFGLLPRQVKEAMEAVHGFPLLHVSVSVNRLLHESVTENKSPAGAADAVAVPIFEVKVLIQRRAHASKHVLAPRFPKLKDEQYCVVVAHEASGELVALKRMSRVSCRCTTTLRVEWDEKWREEERKGCALDDDAWKDGVTLTVYVVCDSFYKFDETCHFTLRCSLQERQQSQPA